MTSSIRCDAEGCENVAYSLGWCRKHRDRFARLYTADYLERRAAAERAWEAQHGTRSRYRKGCRCTTCRRAEADYRSRYRKARP